jgi:hypothetical protein
MTTETKPQFEMCDCKSSQLHSHGYDSATKTMAIRFHKRAKDGSTTPGAVYHYHDVSQVDYDALTKAESLGKHFGAHVRNTFKFTKQG